MTISFNNFPSTIRVPFVGVEISNENAASGSAVQPYKILAIGQRLSAGTVLANVPTRVTSAAQAKTYFGQGSMLAQMVERLVKNNSFTELWCVAANDDAAGAAATGSIAFSGTATAAGTLFAYIGGRRLTVGINSGMTAAALATAVAAAITAAADLAVSASAATSTVTLTSKHKGVAGNYIDIRLNYNDGEATPAGITPTITAMSGGTSNPTLDTLIASLGDVQYNVIAFPYTDAVSLTAIETELQSRWGPLRQNEGVAFAASNVNHSGLGTLGNGRNSPFVSIMGGYGIPNTPWEVAAAYAGTAAYYSNIDPARQFKTLPLTDILPPKLSDRFTLQERNILLYDGISTFTVDAGGVVRIERAITTYETNAAGADDDSYLDVMTPLLLGYLRYSFRTYIMNKYPRHKLANDGTRYGAGQAIITPKVGKAEAIKLFRQWEDAGYVENADQFKSDLICERNASDPNRLDWNMSPDLINNFMVGGAKIAFLLQGSELTDA